MELSCLHCYLLHYKYEGTLFLCFTNSKSEVFNSFSLMDVPSETE